MGIEEKNQDDGAIIQAVPNGHKETFRVLVDRYNTMLFGYAFSLCGDYDTSSDLVQEALITAYKCLDRL